MIIKTIPVGQLEANCYVVMDEEANQALIIDPGDEPDMVLEQVEGFDVQYIILTHAHFDHIGAVSELKEITGAQIALHEADLSNYTSARDHAAFWGFSMDSLPNPDILLKEGDEIQTGNLSLVVIHTPGHSPGSISLYLEGVVFTGDTLFAGSVGRTDLPGGNMAQLKTSFRRLMTLPDDTTVLSGHGMASTIGREREENMFSLEFLS